MSNTICPHCGHNRSNNATSEAWVCPACNKKYYQAKGGAGSRQLKIPKAAFAIIAAVAIIIFTPSENAKKRPELSPEDQARVAILMQEAEARHQVELAKQADEIAVKSSCLEAAKQGLKAPTTAQFSRVEAYIHPDGTATASAYVDSQNSFGAMMRGLVRCKSSKRLDTWTTEATFAY